MKANKHLEDKIVACHGHLTYSSIAKTLGTTPWVVHYYMRKHGKQVVYPENQINRRLD